MYADAVTRSMRKAIDETARRRATQERYNREHGITPQTIRKAIAEALVVACEADYVDLEASAAAVPGGPLAPAVVAARVRALREEMRAAAKALEFERAATLRDEIRALEQRAVGLRADA
jgi:excinuclease ABC subunit B